MVAYTLFVPAGWKTDGGLEYARLGSCDPPTRIDWTAKAPDGLGELRIIPEEQWGSTNFPVPEDGCLRAPVVSARGYLEWWAQRHRPGARVLDYRARPELTKPFESLTQTTENLKSWADAGELLLGYQVGGREVREAIVTTVFLLVSRLPAIGGAAPMEQLHGSSAPGFSLRMPNGALDFKAMDALRQSVHSAPEWQARMNRSAAERARMQTESNRQMAETNRRAAADRSAIIAGTARDINAMQMGAWQSASASSDRTQRESIEAIRGVETYNDPHYGGTVQLSSQFSQAWQLNDGSYLLTDDLTFDPARDLGVPGQRLQRAP